MKITKLIKLYIESKRKIARYKELSIDISDYFFENKIICRDWASCFLFFVALKKYNLIENVFVSKDFFDKYERQIMRMQVEKHLRIAWNIPIQRRNLKNKKVYITIFEETYMKAEWL